jgi:hypothetical protein
MRVSSREMWAVAVLLLSALCGTGSGCVRGTGGHRHEGDAAGSQDGALGTDGGLDAVAAGDASLQSDAPDLQTDPHNCGAIGHDCQGGECIAGACQPMLVNEGSAAACCDIAVHGESVYWVTFWGEAFRAPISGGDAVNLASVGGAIARVAVDATGVYFTHSGNNGAVMRVDLSGGDPVVLAEAPWASGLAVDSVWVYYVAITTETNALMKVSKAGGEPVKLVDDAYAGEVAAGESGVYYGGYNGSTAAAVYRAPASEGASVLVAEVPGTDSFGGLVVDQTTAFVVSENGVVASIGLAGGAVDLLVVSAPGAPLLRVAVDEDQVYYASSVGAMRVARGGGTAENLGPGDVRAVACDDTAVYWCESGYGAKIWKLAK